MRTPAPLAPEDPPYAGRFRLLGRLAQGGMGLVYLARRDDRPDSLVAVKMIKPELVGDPALRALFAREIAASWRVSAEGRATHVARTVDADADAARPWLAIEFVPGPSLAEEVAARPQTAARVMRIARDLAEAVDALHSEGMTHGDLKPTNVVLGPDGLRLVDLGLAQDHTDADRAPRAWHGSPGWSPPELGGSAALTTAMDVHGWGMTVAFAATGRPPFGAGPLHEVRERMLWEAPDLDGVPAALLPLVAAALAPDPAMRPSAGMLLDELPGLHGRADTVPVPLPSPTVAGAGTAPLPDVDEPATGLLVPPTLLDTLAEGRAPHRVLLPAFAVAAVTAAVLVASGLLLALVGTGSPPAAGSTPTSRPTAAAASATTVPAASTSRATTPAARVTSSTLAAAAPAARATPAGARKSPPAHGKHKHRKPPKKNR